MKIRDLRKARGLTQRALAGDDLSVSFISMVEHGKVRPSLGTLRLLADRLGVTSSSLLSEADRPGEAEARLRHGDVLLRQHRLTPALEAYQAAEALAMGAGDQRLLTRAHLGLGQALLGLRQFDLADEHLRRADSGSRELADAGLAALAANARGLLAIRRRRFRDARAHLTDALAFARRSDPPDRRLEAIILTNLGRVFLNLGLPGQALASFDDARAFLERAADPAALAMLDINSGIAAIQERAFDEAAAYLERASAHLEIQENLQLLGGVKRNQGMLLLERGQPADAEPLLRQSLAIAERLADDAGRAATLTELARAALAQGRTPEAGRWASEAVRLAQQLEDPAEGARGEAVLGAVARAEGRWDDAVERYHRAADAFGQLDMEKERAEALRDLGYLHMEAGREGEAARAFAQAFTAQGAWAAARR
jgi:tetratricopeptide (TPR) repeat protein